MLDINNARQRPLVNYRQQPPSARILAGAFSSPTGGRSSTPPLRDLLLVDQARLPFSFPSRTFAPRRPALLFGHHSICWPSDSFPVMQVTSKLQAIALFQHGPVLQRVLFFACSAHPCAYSPGRLRPSDAQIVSRKVGFLYVCVSFSKA
jgi:hypothetical protein